MIKSFYDKTTEDIFNGKSIKNIDRKLVEKARRRIEQLNAATKLEDMYFPSSNRLHLLVGFNPSRYAIYVNKQWRITFGWIENNATEVRFEDYHP